MRVRGHERYRLGLVVAVCCLALSVVACSTLSVSHLDSRPIASRAPADVTMKFWRFAFTGALSGDAYVVRGRATPVTTDLPPWVDRVTELTIAAYLRDPAGNVLATAEKKYPSMALTPDAAVPFEFILAPAGSAAGNYAISFGYKAIYSSDRARSALGSKGPLPAGSVFFAGEGAVRKN